MLSYRKGSSTMSTKEGVGILRILPVDLGGDGKFNFHRLFKDIRISPIHALFRCFLWPISWFATTPHPPIFVSETSLSPFFLQCGGD